MTPEEPVIIPETFLQKLLFYTTAFFILLGIFSLFAFLFLVPFVIEPAFTTIFMEFDPVAAFCQTVDAETRQGVSNCSWSSCREGCTREVYECTQIRVNYKILPVVEEEVGEEVEVGGDEKVEDGKLEKELHLYLREKRSLEKYEFLLRNLKHLRNLFVGPPSSSPVRLKRALQDYPSELFEEEEDWMEDMITEPERTGLMGNDSEWYFTGAKLFPNVKGCGYPPMLNCSIFLKKYKEPGTNFSCFYSQVDPGLVINDFDIFQVYMNLVYAMAIPIPSFILSVIYLTFAYFKIYNEDEDEALVKEDGDEEEEDGEKTPVPPLTSGAITPGSEIFREDLVSFGHQLKVAMADEMSRESVADAVPVNSNSITGGPEQYLQPGYLPPRVGMPRLPPIANLSKTMTTSISTTHGPIADV
uniref:Protein tipE n=2 Tax=Timema TaxID=61471 RepID=A0A7R9AW87_TIMSH|nr:unnamed protein product [Timema shepardi]